MQMHEVKSSNIAAIGHDLDIMTVQFHNGGIYEFKNVTEDEFEEILFAPSVGRAFSCISRNPEVYPYRKVTQ